MDWFCPHTTGPLPFSSQPAFWMNLPCPWLWGVSWASPLHGLSPHFGPHFMSPEFTCFSPSSVSMNPIVFWVKDSEFPHFEKRNHKRKLFSGSPCFFYLLTLSLSWWAGNLNDSRSLNRVLGVKETCLNGVFKRYNRIRLLLARKTSSCLD